MIEKINKKNFWLLLRTLFFVVLIIIAKLCLHLSGIELLSINNLFSGILAGTIFLMGFLLTGVMTDYKESEKIPGEIASLLSSIYDEFLLLYKKTDDPSALKGMKHIASLTRDIRFWFYKKIKTKELITSAREINVIFGEIEHLMQANHIVRLKNELSSLKKTITRADTIRDTDFVSSGYLIASSMTVLLCAGLVFSKIEPFYESLFVVGVISFLMVFMLLLIHDLDNPFGYNNRFSAENVSLHPIYRFEREIEEIENSIVLQEKTNTVT